MIAPKLTALLKKINETKGNTSTKFAVFELTSHIPFDVIDKKITTKAKAIRTIRERDRDRE